MADRTYAGHAGDGLPRVAPMVREIETQLEEIGVAKNKPGAIVMSPRRLSALLNEVSRTPGAWLGRTDEGSGWKFNDIPIYRSHEIIGVTVVSADLKRVLLQSRQYSMPTMPAGSPMKPAEQYDTAPIQAAPLIF